MRYPILAALLFFALPAQAQPSGDEPKPDWFTVELVVFEQAGDRGIPPPDPHVPETEDAVILQEVFQQLGTGDGPPEPMLPLPQGLRFLPAPPVSGTLEQAVTKLEESPAYRPVLRMTWRQRVGAFSDPLPVRVRGGAVLGRMNTDHAAPTLADGGALPAAGMPDGSESARELRAIHEVDGTVALVRGRYLHLNVELVFREHEASLVTRGAPAAAARNHPLAAYPSWRISERREIRAGELHYFDHRRFGMIAVAEPWLAPEPSEREKQSNGIQQAPGPTPESMPPTTSARSTGATEHTPNPDER